MMEYEAVFRICNKRVFSTVGPEGMDTGPPTAEPNSDDLYTDLSLNSLVEVTLGKGNSYGIVRWIGVLPERQEVMAGLELVTCFQTDDTGLCSFLYSEPPVIISICRRKTRE